MSIILVIVISMVAIFGLMKINPNLSKMWVVIIPFLISTILFLSLINWSDPGDERVELALAIVVIPISTIFGVIGASSVYLFQRI